jgi:hypothetical protein
MSDRTPENQDVPTETSHHDGVNSSRRKLTGAALGVSAVFTLASRPVWANQCSISGMASGNTSAPDVTCEGCTPGYWGRCQHFSAWAEAGYSTTQTFNDVFQVTEYTDCSGIAYTLLDVLFLQGGLKTCGATQENKNNKPANRQGAPSSCTNGNAFDNLGGDPVSTNLGFHAVAALLNAAHPAVNYGYEPGDIIALFKKHYKSNGSALKDMFVGLNERGCSLGK